MVFFCPKSEKSAFCVDLLSKKAKEIGPVIRFVPLYREPDAYIIFLIFPPNAGATKDGYFPQKEIKSLPYNSFFKSSMSGRALRSRSGISLDAR